MFPFFYIFCLIIREINPHCHIPVRINPCEHETSSFLAGHPLVIAAVGDGIDADVEADEYSALMDVRDRSGILAMDLALA